MRLAVMVFAYLVVLIVTGELVLLSIRRDW